MNVKQGYLDVGYPAKIGGVRVIGGIMTHSWEVSCNGHFLRRGDNDAAMHVKEGKIIYWEKRRQ